MICPFYFSCLLLLLSTVMGVSHSDLLAVTLDLNFASYKRTPGFAQAMRWMIFNDPAATFDGGALSH